MTLIVYEWKKYCLWDVEMSRKSMEIIVYLFEEIVIQ